MRPQSPHAAGANSVGFEDPACGAEAWSRLLHCGDTDVVFLTRQWLRPWWETRGEGRLLLVAAERDGEVVALAPTYAADGTILFLRGGRVGLPRLHRRHQRSRRAAGAARRRARRGRRVSRIQVRAGPRRSPTGLRLRDAAARLALECFVKDELPVRSRRRRGASIPGDCQRHAAMRAGCPATCRANLPRLTLKNLEISENPPLPARIAPA
jgi:hypothetical protein